MNRTPTEVVTLELPFPPSINRLWRGGNGRVFRSRSYTAWLYEAGNRLEEQNPGIVVGNYSLSVALSPPDKRRRDLDNFSAKAISDLLVEHGCITDDQFCLAINARWVDYAGPLCRVTILAVSPQLEIVT